MKYRFYDPYNRKISRRNLLKFPGNAGDTNDSGDGGGNGGDGNQNKSDGGDGKGKPTPKPVTGEGGLDDIYGGDDDSGDISLPDDNDGSDDQLTAEQVEAGKTLATKLNQSISGFVVKAEDIPDEIGFGDKAKAAEYMTTLQQNSMKTILGMMAPVINHALGISFSKIDGRIAKAVKSTDTQTEASRAFNALGFDGADKKLAKQFFETAMSTKKMTHSQAAVATKKAMAQLGKSGKSQNQNSGNNDRSGETGIQSGTEALDSMFG